MVCSRGAGVDAPAAARPKAGSRWREHWTDGGWRSSLPPGLEQVELTGPWQAVVDAGGAPFLLSLKAGDVQTGNSDINPGDTFRVDTIVAEARVNDYDALVLPGGVANPDTLRSDADAVRFVHDFIDSAKPVAAICHAPWTLIEAGAVRGRRLTSFPSLATDIRNAGGTWVDEKVVIDANLITSRNPDDIPAFNDAILHALTPPS